MRPVDRGWMRLKILVVDDDQVLVKGLTRSLLAVGHEVWACFDGQEAMTNIDSLSPEMVILDVMLPGKDGFAILQDIRRRYPDLPVIMLTARAEDIDKVLGLEMGADDYISKPFSVRELEARIKALARRLGPTGGKAQVRKGDLLLDLDGRRVWKREREVYLTPKEFDVLAFLVRNSGTVMTREKLLEHCWGYDFFGDTRAVDIQVSRLREKIEDDPQKPTIILTRRGTGYYCE